MAKYKAEYYLEVEKYVKYIRDHLNFFIEKINTEFENNKQEIQEFVFNNIKEIFKDGDPTHYEWYDDECPYDDSGEIKPMGVIDTEQSLYEFYRLEYSGEWMATYESHHGMHYITYGDEFSYNTFDYADKSINRILKKNLDEIFPGKIDDFLFNHIQESVFDDLYIDSIAYDFGCIEGVLDFVGINDILIKDVLRDK